MKKLIVSAALLMLPLFLLTERLHGETKENELTIGISSGVSKVEHKSNSNFRFDNENANEFVNVEYYDLENIGSYYGISTEYKLNSFDLLRSSVLLNISYNFMSANTTRPAPGGYPVKRVNKDGDVIIEQSTSNYELDIEYHTLNFDLLYNIFLVDNFGIFLGPSIALPVVSNETQSRNILTPEDASFANPDPDDTPEGHRYRNDNRTYIFQEGEIKNSNPVRVGLIIGLQYEINISDFYIIPRINYNYPLTNIIVGEDWKVELMQAGVDVRYSL